MRTAADLIEELDAESQGGLVLCVLIVSFENTTLFVASSAGLQSLNELIGRGGEPVGFFRVRREAGNWIVEVRPLVEYAEDQEASRYLLTVLADLRENSSIK
jgi:hypothetical protein